MRWKIHLRYLGTHYCGWQKQPGDVTVQQTLEDAFRTILRQPVEIVGCGRTDTGVHARAYVAHMDAAGIDAPSRITYQVNAILPSDISVVSMVETDIDFHARFQAIDRMYRYYIHFEKDPFLTGQSFYFHRNVALDTDAMEKVARLLLRYERYEPFCKTGSDAEHFRCRMVESNWIFTDDQAVYSVRANRFLRGMVRLIVGTCLNVGLGKVHVDQVAKCLDDQTPLPHTWSVPPEGLFLEEIRYPIHPDII